MEHHGELLKRPVSFMEQGVCNVNIVSISESGENFTLTIRTSDPGSEDVFLRSGRRVEVKTNGEKRLEVWVITRHVPILESVIKHT